jgi:hypothetical protein
MTRDKLAIEQTSGPERINIHGAINLESGQTRMIDVQTVDATSTITLLEVIEALYPLMMLWGLMHRNVTHDNATQPVRSSPTRAWFPARTSSSQLGSLLRFSHRQLPRHLAQECSGHDVNGVYYILHLSR